MSAHTKEPWNYAADRASIISGDGTIIADMCSAHLPDGSDDDNARRIVACVNACAGLRDDYLTRAVERGGIKAAISEASQKIFTLQATLAGAERERDALREQVAELARSLADALNYIERDCVKEGVPFCFTRARAALDKVKP